MRSLHGRAAGLRGRGAHELKAASVGGDPPATGPRAPGSPDADPPWAVRSRTGIDIQSTDS